MAQNAIEHENAVGSWVTLRIARSGKITNILTIETDLDLDPEAHGYQKDKVNSLIDAAVAYVREHVRIDTIEIGPLREGAYEVTSIGGDDA
jgi:hypothetical protein